MGKVLSRGLQKQVTPYLYHSHSLVTVGKSLGFSLPPFSRQKVGIMLPCFTRMLYGCIREWGVHTLGLQKHLKQQIKMTRRAEQSRGLSGKSYEEGDQERPKEMIESAA